MNDSVKAALELAQETAQMKCDCLDCQSLRVLLAHINGEPARAAAAITVAKEEQREACAEAAAQWACKAGLAYGEPSHLFDTVAAVPLVAKEKT